MNIDAQYMHLFLNVILMIVCILGATTVLFFNYQFNNGKFHYFYLYIKFIIEVSIKPLLSLLILYFLYLLLQIIIPYFPNWEEHFSTYNEIELMDFLVGAIFFWWSFNFIRIGNAYLMAWAEKVNHKTISIILPAVSSSFYIVFFLIMINVLVPSLNLNPGPEFILKKIIKAFLIMMFGWVFVKMLNAFEKFIFNQYVMHNVNTLTARKIHTQLLILKRVLISIMFVIVFASILMLFDSVKNLGTGLLTTAGIVSAVGAFASQQSLSRIFSGLLIAFTQPVRIGDTVIIDNELGQVEEITLSYVVVKLWDLRRLILPTDFFMNKGLQNLTRDSSELLGTVYIYTDYTLPVNAIRNKYLELLNASTLWDRKVSAFHVTDIKENCMEIRALMSAENSAKLWELRCQMREQLINFIVEHFPDCLSKSRNTTKLTKYSEQF